MGSGIQAGRWGALRLFRLLPVLLLAGCSFAGHQLRHLSGSAADRLADDVVIERDGYGVPHVHGRSDAAVAFGLAYAMAEDNYWQVEEDMLQALGWASHYWGERYLGHDLVRAAWGVVASARAEYETEPTERQQVWAAFAHGLNHYLRHHPNAPKRLLTRYEPWMILARGRTFDLHTGADGVTLAAIATQHGVTGPAPYPVPPADRSWARAAAPAQPGSPALLLAALDAPYFGSGQLYEAELHSDHGVQAAGALLLGTPVLGAGMNADIAWAQVPPAAPELRRLVFGNGTDSLAYRDGAEWLRAEVHVDTIRVNTSAGVVARTFRFTRTRHGPVLERHGDTAYVLRVPGALEGGVLARALAVSRATSLEQLRAELSSTTVPALRVVGVDAAGNTLSADGSLLRAEPATADSLLAAAFDTQVPAATSQVAALVNEWEMIGGSNPRRAFALDSAIELLRGWDRRFTVTSRPALLYHRWQEEYVRGGYAQGGYGRFRALEAVLARPLRGLATWGEANRLQRRHTSGAELFADSLPSLPFGAAPAGTSAAFAAASRQDLGARRYAVHGRAWTGLMELAQPPRLRSVLAFGASALPTSAHFFDQAALFVEGQLKELPLGAAVQAQVRERYHPGQRARVLQR